LDRDTAHYETSEQRRATWISENYDIRSEAVLPNSVKFSHVLYEIVIILLILKTTSTFYTNPPSKATNMRFFLTIAALAVAAFAAPLPQIVVPVSNETGKPVGQIGFGNGGETGTVIIVSIYLNN
jgi:hypothetical protein